MVKKLETKRFSYWVVGHLQSIHYNCIHLIVLNIAKKIICIHNAVRSGAVKETF